MLSRPDFMYKNVVLVLAKNKEQLSFKNDNLIVKDQENKILFQTTCYRVFALWIVGPFQLSSGLIERAKKFGFSILFFSFGFKFIDAINSKTEGNVLLRQKQYQYKKWDIGRYLVNQKIANQMALLQTIRDKNLFLKQSIKSMKVRLRKDLPEAVTLEEIMGIEGICSKLFFTEWFSGMDWRGRKPRTKNDPTNVLLDIGYTLLFNYVDAMLQPLWI
ncbi:MAG: CRISPR-associated endonuclease Cas1 [Flavobacteriaceae bacterium]|nr:CRISPR-associated endonuclease Cas1 [Flavobacteriaceae bacterium]